MVEMIPSTSSSQFTTWVPHFKLSQFSVVSQLGHGGEGAVYLANNDQFGDVALKRLDRSIALDENKGEAHLLVKIKHPHIVQIFGVIVEEHGTTQYSGFIMEYLKMGSLHSVIYNPEIKYGLKQIFSWIIQICRGLQYLHDQKIIHRDVKPKNILLSSMDTAKLADFGMAKEMKTGSITYCVGTAAYMAPEVIMNDNNRRYTQPADVYSLAITIWEMIHRKFPFHELEDASFMTVAMKILGGDRPIIDMDEVDQELAELLQTGWHQDPIARVSLMEIKTFAIRRLETTVEEIPLPAMDQKGGEVMLKHMSMMSNKVMSMEKNLKRLLDIQRKEIETLRLTTEKMRKEMEWFGDSSQTIIIMGGNKDESTGSTGELLLLNKDRTDWKKLALKLPNWSEHGGSVLLNEEIYVFGGHRLHNKVYKLDVVEVKWIQMPSMNSNRNWIINSSLVFDGCIWVLGGFDGTDSLDSVEKYCPRSNKWTHMPPMKEQRSAPAAVVCNGKIIVSGGENNAGNRLKTIECFDPISGIWSQFLPEMPGPRNGHAIVFDGKNLTILGGWDGKLDYSSVWQINPEEKNPQWRELNSMQQTSRQFSALLMEKNMILAIGGFSVNHRYGLRRVEMFDGEKWQERPQLPGGGYFISSAFWIPVHLAVSLLRIK